MVPSHERLVKWTAMMLLSLTASFAIAVGAALKARHHRRQKRRR